MCPRPQSNAKAHSINIQQVEIYEMSGVNKTNFLAGIGASGMDKAPLNCCNTEKIETWLAKYKGKTEKLRADLLDLRRRKQEGKASTAKKSTKRALPPDDDDDDDDEGGDDDDDHSPLPSLEGTVPTSGVAAVPHLCADTASHVMATLTGALFAACIGVQRGGKLSLPGLACGLVCGRRQGAAEV